MKSKYFQLGLSGGTPAGINFCVGYWLSEPNDYLMAQVCGMHFGSTLYGLQLDVGKAFYRTKTFRAFWAGSMRRSHVDLAGTPVDFFGLGPSVGMNWNSFIIELGLHAGKGTNTKLFPYSKNTNNSESFAVQVAFQIGVKGLFWQ